MQKIEQIEHKPGGITPVGSVLNRLKEVMPLSSTAHNSPSR
jgi:hypothetical protein